ncbi:hypothetical protein BVX99_01120 [bacterium F16]|nr:hypothetical protein BVX99_01120 [bacterium F16]
MMIGILAQMTLDQTVDPTGNMSVLVRLAVIFGAAATGCAVWGILQIGTTSIDKWQKRFLEEAEVELQDMLIQMPVAKLVNYSLIIGSLLSIAMFFITSPGENGFNWKFGLGVSIAVFLATQFGSRMSIRLLKLRRLTRFNDQLEDALMSMGNALKAGFSINQAVEMVIKQKKNPISLEFKLMIQQTQLGVTFDEALRNMAKRIESEDFFLVVSAIITARQTGGDLTGVFERLAQVIRERMRIQRRIKTLTAQGRMQGMVLGLMPVILLAVLYFFVDPNIVRGFFSHPIGIAAAVVVAILETCGFLVIRKIVNVDI